MHVRVVGPFRPADASHAKSAPRQLATDRAAEETGGTGDHREGARPGGRCLAHGRRSGRAWRDRAPDADRESLVDSRHTSQMIYADGRTIARSRGGIETPQQFHQPRIVGAADEPLREACGTAPCKPRRFQKGIGDLFQRARARVRRTEND